MKGHPLWIDAGEVARCKTLDAETPTRALIVDLDDPVLAPLLQLEPTQRDVADETTKLAGPRTYFLRRRALLRHLVSLRLGCAPRDVVVAHDAQGAPRVIAPDPAVYVSVSARGACAGLAVSDAPVGVDIEIVGAAHEPVWDVLHPGERAAMEKPFHSRFHEVWVAKEAYLKALRTGLNRDPATVAVTIDPLGTFRISDDLRPGLIFEGIWDDRIIGKRLVCCACIALD